IMDFCYNLAKQKINANVNIIDESLTRDQCYTIFESDISDIYSSRNLNQNTDESNLAQQIKDDTTCSNYFLNGDSFDDKTHSLNSNSAPKIKNVSDESSDNNIESNKLLNPLWQNQSEPINFEISLKKNPDDSRQVDESAHIKRPMNAFMVWSQTERKMIASEYPKMHNSDISKILGTRWKELTNEQKKPYIKMAKQLQHKHNVEHPNYKYKPRRKVKRGTKNVIHMGQFPVCSNVTNQIEKYLNGYNTFENNGMGNLRRYNNDMYMPKQLILTNDNSVNGCLPNLSKMPSMDSSIPNYIPSSYFEFPMKSQNFRNNSVNQIPFNSNSMAFGFPSTFDHSLYQQNANFSTLDPQNHLSFLPFVPMVNHNQYPMSQSQFISISNAADNIREQAILNGIFFINLTSEKKVKNDFEFNSNSTVKKDKIGNEISRNIINFNEECADNFAASSISFSNQSPFNPSCIEEPSKIINSSYQMGVLGIQDFGQYCFNSFGNESNI
ncbi:hypothetical protein MXB_3166, partial [Myxobolus squamalis]